MHGIAAVIGAVRGQSVDSVLEEVPLFMAEASELFMPADKLKGLNNTRTNDVEWNLNSQKGWSWKGQYEW